MHNITLEDFLKETKKVKEKRTFKVTNSIGSSYAYRIYKRDINALSNHDYCRVIREINNEIINRIIEGDIINLPLRMGNLCIVKKETKVVFNKDKLYIDKPIDWNKTAILWYNNEEAREAKKIVRNDVPYVFRIKYSKGHAMYKNKNFFRFKTHRPVKLKIKDLVQKNELEALMVD